MSTGKLCLLPATWHPLTKKSQQLLHRVDINVDCQPAAASDVYNMQRNQAGLDGQGFGLSQSSSTTGYASSPGTHHGFSQGFSSSQSSCQTTVSIEAESSEDMDTADTVSSNAGPWGIQPFAGIGKRPLVSPASSPVKQKPRVSLPAQPCTCLDSTALLLGVAFQLIASS